MFKTNQFYKNNQTGKTVYTISVGETDSGKEAAIFIHPNNAKKIRITLVDKFLETHRELENLPETA